MAELLYQVRAGAAVAMLLWASWLDLKERRVRNPFWFPWLALAAALVVAEISLSGGLPWLALAIAAVSCAVFYAFWWIGILFGGADAKGLMVVALLVPTTLLLPAATTPALDTLVNGVLLTMAVPLALLVWNLSHGRFSGLAILLAVPMPLLEARTRFVWPLDRIQDGRHRRVLLQRRDDDLDEIYDALQQAGVREVWATPKIPFMVPMTLGLLVAIFWGNILLRAMAQIMAQTIVP